MSTMSLGQGLQYSFLLVLAGSIPFAFMNLSIRKSIARIQSKSGKIRALETQLSQLKTELEAAKNQLSKAEEDFKKKLVISNLTVIESERKKIGSDMHDFIGSMLWAIKVQLGVVTRKGEPNEFGLRAIQKANEVMEKTLENTRKIIQQLVPKTLKTRGLSEAIREHCEDINTDNMLFEFSESGDFASSDLCDRQKIILFRVVQEILNNCVKYSEATSVGIRISWGTNLAIDIVNNGKPFQMEDCLATGVRGVGVYNVVERVKALKGSIFSQSGPPNTILIQIPRDEK